MKNEIHFIFESKITTFNAVGTIKFEWIDGLKGESYLCILAYNKQGERRIIDTRTIIHITPLLD